MNSDHHLEDLIAKATQTIAAAVKAMEHTNRELVCLFKIRACRPWSGDEFARYLELSQREDAAHRQYLAGRRWFDNARRTRSEQRSYRHDQ
jgi:hypothetical protein